MSLQLAAASYTCIHYGLKKKRKERRRWQRQLYTSREVYSGSSLVADLNLQSVGGLYKNFARMSPSEFEILICLIGEKNLEKGQSVQESHFCSRKVGTDCVSINSVTLPSVHFILQLPKRSTNRTALQIRTTLQERSIRNEKKGGRW